MPFQFIPRHARPAAPKSPPPPLRLLRPGINDLPLTATDFLCLARRSLPSYRAADLLARGLTASRAEPRFLRYCLECRGLRHAPLPGASACRRPPTTYGQPTANSTATCPPHDCPVGAPEGNTGR
ncbi:MAG: hypothetical protein WKG07_49270 [Hymenobacter sp.]